MSQPVRALGTFLCIILASTHRLIAACIWYWWMAGCHTYLVHVILFSSHCYDKISSFCLPPPLLLYNYLTLINVGSYYVCVPSTYTSLCISSVYAWEGNTYACYPTLNTPKCVCMHATLPHTHMHTHMGTQTYMNTRLLEKGVWVMLVYSIVRMGLNKAWAHRVNNVYQRLPPYSL